MRECPQGSPFADVIMTNQTKLAMNLALVLSMTLASACPGQAAQRNERRAAPDHIPPRRSSQIQNGPGGVNTSLPREPYVPWNRWWWTRMFDGGFKWVRIGQYEDSSDVTGWDWIEQKRGHLPCRRKLTMSWTPW